MSRFGSQTRESRSEALTRKEHQPNDAIALCLSGGGLRATLFHLGVVKALRSAGNGPHALSGVTEIYSVSGGSILAVHMLLNWERYTGSAEDFQEVEKEMIDFAGRNVRDRILRRWILFRPIGLFAELMSRVPAMGGMIGRWDGLFGRTYWLQREYEALAHRKNFCDLESDGSGAAVPKGHFLSTSFTTGELVSFSGSDFEVELRDPDIEPKLASTPCGHLRLSFAVAASSAFPPMFPPITLTDDMLANPLSEVFFKRLRLSDGGVFDNLGIEKFQKTLERNADHPHNLIISDAGGSFRSSNENSFGGVISRNIRASDILMHRIGDDAKVAISALKGVNDISIRIGTTVDDKTLPPAVQQRFRLVRTDLDRFAPDLAALLVEQGGRVARQALQTGGLIAAADATSTARLSSAEVDRIDAIARKAADRHFWSLISSVRDWTLYPLVLLAAAIGVGTLAYAYISWDAIQTRHENEAIARAADQNRLKAAETNAQRLRARTRDQERKIERVAVAFDAKNFVEVESLLRNELAAVANQIKSDDVAIKSAAAAVEVTSPPVAPPVVAPARPPSPPPPAVHGQKVYIQFAGLITRETITNLNSKLKSVGWLAQSTSGERLAQAYGRNEVRYSGANEQAANELRDAINASGLMTNRVVARRNNIIGPNDLEVWISN
jgi:predicted acylesterase/phospholipase RssA